MSFPGTINLYFLSCFEWHSSLSESSGKIPTAFNRSKVFLFHVCLVIQLFLSALTWVDQFSSASKHCFTTISSHSDPYPAFQAQRVVLSGTIYIQQRMCCLCALGIIYKPHCGVQGGVK